MEKVLVTAASGRYTELLNIALPSFGAFCRAQGYTLVVGTGDERAGRPPSWGKVPLLRELVARCDAALWVDVDAVILRSDRDPLEDLEPSAFQGLVMGTSPIGPVPNCGVWLLRGGDASARFLDTVWNQTRFIDHPWWEQAAVGTLLGHIADDDGHSRPGAEWVKGTAFLPSEWNALRNGREVRIRHYAGLEYKDRRAQMRADVADVQGRRSEAAIRRTAFRALKSAQYRSSQLVGGAKSALGRPDPTDGSP